jgi:serine/threonine protein kinase
LELGEGHFGNVYLGMVKCKRTNRILPVAVKMAKLGIDNEDEVEGIEDSNLKEKTVTNRIKTLRIELSIMAYLQRQKEGQHPNLIRLIGTTTTKDDNQFCLMTEYCEYGSLHDYLQMKYENKQFIDEIPVCDNSINDDDDGDTQSNNETSTSNVRTFY